MKNISKLALVMLVSSSILLQSCATILGGSKDSVWIKNGNPNKAKVYYNGHYEGTATERIRVSKSKHIKDDYIEIKEEGLTEKIQLDKKTMIGYFLLDLIIFFPSLIIDYASGNIYTPTPGKIHYDLQRDPSYNESEKYSINEQISFEYKEKIIDGVILEKKYNRAIVEFTKGEKKKTKEVFYSRISKSQVVKK